MLSVVEPAERSDIAPFYVMEVMKAASERGRTHGDVLHLEVGQPSTPAPGPVRAAAHAALDDDRIGYTHALGFPELRERIAASYEKNYGRPVEAEQIAVTVGASGGCVLAFLACFEPGDRVAVTEPGYPCYRNMLTAFDIEPVPIPMGPGQHFRLDPSQLSPDLDGVVLASPNNPTGTMVSDDELRAIADRCSELGIRLISDEIYHGITYERPAETVLAYSKSAVVVQSFSKYYSMTGWRLGWLVLPPNMVGPVERLAQNLTIAAPTLSQYAGIAAFDSTDEAEANVARYAENRRLLLAGLPRAGIEQLAPADGAFYIYGDISELSDDAQRLCQTWLSETGVAATPGIDFDTSQGHRYVRFSYSESTADITEAIDRLVAWAER